MKMRWLAVAILAVLAIPGSGTAPRAQGKASGPVIEIKETTYDFGQVFKSMEKFRHDFVVRNVGTADLVIEEVKPG